VRRIAATAPIRNLVGVVAEAGPNLKQQIHRNIPEPSRIPGV
jgi:hypothetical protein